MSKTDPCGFTAIFNEVCSMDCYRIRGVPFTPDVVIDIGANVGVFTSYARFMFPDAKIIGVEPDPENFRHLTRLTEHLRGITLLKMALGTGQIWHAPTPDILATHNEQWKENPDDTPYYGACQSYTTLNQLGYPESWLENDVCFEPAYDGIKSISLDVLMKDIEPDAKVLAKIDCEGGENCIFTHEPSMAALRRLDYLAMEIHFWTKGTVPEYEANKQTMIDTLMSLSDTHDCVMEADKNYFQATKRGITNA